MPQGPTPVRLFSRALVFGSVAVALHGNVFSRFLAELANRYLGIPLLSFFDDFGALIPSCLARTALQTFTAFCSLLRIRLKAGKSAYWPAWFFSA